MGQMEVIFVLKRFFHGSASFFSLPYKIAKQLLTSHAFALNPHNPRFVFTLQFNKIRALKSVSHTWLEREATNQADTQRDGPWFSTN